MCVLSVCVCVRVCTYLCMYVYVCVCVCVLARFSTVYYVFNTVFSILWPLQRVELVVGQAMLIEVRVVC